MSVFKGILCVLLLCIAGTALADKRYYYITPSYPQYLSCNGQAVTAPEGLADCFLDGYFADYFPAYTYCETVNTDTYYPDGRYYKAIQKARYDTCSRTKQVGIGVQFRDCPANSPGIDLDNNYQCLAAPSCEAPLVNTANGCACPDGKQHWAGMNLCLDPCADGETRNATTGLCGCPDLPASQQTGACASEDCPSGQTYSALTQQCEPDEHCLLGDPDGDGVCGCPANQVYYQGDCVADNCIIDDTNRTLCNNPPDELCLTRSSDGKQYCIKDNDPDKNCITGGDGSRHCYSEQDSNNNNENDPYDDKLSSDPEEDCRTFCSNHGGIAGLITSNGKATTYNEVVACQCTDGAQATGGAYNNDEGTDGNTDNGTGNNGSGDGTDNGTGDGDGDVSGKDIVDANDRITSALNSQLNRVNDSLDTLTGGAVSVPGEGSGQFSTDDLDTDTQQLKADIYNQIQVIKAEFNQIINSSSPTGTGSLPCWRDISIMQNRVSFDICFEDYEDELSIIPVFIVGFSFILAAVIMVRGKAND